MAITEAREEARRLIVLLRSEFSKTEYEREHLVVAFSGGLDSSLIAKLASERADVSGIVVGTEGSIDARNAKRSAELIGMELLQINIDEEHVVDRVREIIKATSLTDPLAISFELPVFFALQVTEENAIVTGQGADELFGGYAKYRGLQEEEFIRMRMADMNKLSGPITIMEKKMAVSLGKTILKPFLGDEVVSFAMSLPISLTSPISERKIIIREALRELGMDEIASMEKKAAQYGSGTSKLLTKAAKTKGLSLGEFILNLKEK